MEPYTAREAMPQFHAVPNKETPGDSPGRGSLFTLLPPCNNVFLALLNFYGIEFHNASKSDFLVLEKSSFSTTKIMLLNFEDIKATNDSVIISVNGILYIGGRIFDALFSRRSLATIFLA